MGLSNRNGQKCIKSGYLLEVKMPRFTYGFDNWDKTKESTQELISMFDLSSCVDEHTV